MEAARLVPRPELAPLLFDRNGNAGPTIWADGRIVGGWTQRADGRLVTQVASPLGRTHQRLLDHELERVSTVLGDVRFNVRFPSPMSTSLRL